MLKDFVYGFYDGMYHDPHLGAMLKKWMQTAPHEMYMKHLKDRTVDYLECVWDDDAWEGQDLFVAHAHLHMTTAFFDKATKCAKSTLKTMSISSNLTKEILKEFAVMKEPITDPEGKFHSWIIQKNKDLEARDAEAAGDMVTTTMGFTISKTQLQAMADKAQKDKDLKDRLAAMRAARKAGEDVEQAHAKVKVAASDALAKAKVKPNAKAKVTKAKVGASVANEKSLEKGHPSGSSKVADEKRPEKGNSSGSSKSFDKRRKSTRCPDQSLPADGCSQWSSEATSQASMPVLIPKGKWTSGADGFSAWSSEATICAGLPVLPSDGCLASVPETLPTTGFILTVIQVAA